MPKSKLLWLIASGVLSSSGTPPAPLLEVFGGVSQDVPIANGDASPATADGTDFGLYRCGVGIVNKDFLLSNANGTADLEITGVDIPSGFAIGESFPFTITAGDDYTLNIETDATANTSQVWSGNVVIHSNADDYTFAITGSTVYSARVLAQSPYDFRQMNEGSGTSIADSSANGHTAGTGTGITWDALQSPPMGGSVVVSDGANDHITINNAGFAAGFNPNEFTILVWVKVDGAGVWTDATVRYLLRLARNVGVNDIQINKSATNNTMVFTRIANSAQKQISVGSQSDTGWVCYGLSCSVAGGGLLSAGDVKAYKNRAQIGATQTGAVNQTNSGLNAALIGASAVTPANVWHGYEAPVIIFNSPMTNDILELMAV